ncbi:MAG: hypothetical protein WEB13_09490 [Dehalococcoidia bacterium]
MQMDTTGYGAGQARRRATLQRTRRFALVGVVAAALALFLATGATFTATNDSVTITPSAANAAPSVLSALAGSQRWTVSTTTSRTAPTWTPTLNTVVGTSAGDIAIVDTTSAGSGTQIVTVAYGNAGALNLAYSYLILPVDIYESNDAGVADPWELVTNTGRYLTLTNGYQQYFLPGGKFYEVHVPAGGSIYTISTSAGSLSPTFIVTVTAG